jgi:hypothetical protein
VTGSQPGQIVHETLSGKTHHKKRAGGVVEAVESNKDEALISSPSPAHQPKKPKLNKLL